MPGPVPQVARRFDKPFDKLAVSVQDLNSDSRKYCAYTWRLSADGKELVLRRLNDQVVPDSLKDSAALRRAIAGNLKNPQLLREELRFTRKPPSGL